MKDCLKHPGGSYLVAVAATAAMVLLRWLLDPWLGNNLTLVTLYGAIAAAVWHGGYRPALVATFLGFAACNYLFMEPRGTFVVNDSHHYVGIPLYLLTCSLIIGFGEAMRHAQRRTQEGQERLRTTLASIGDAVIATDNEGRITTMNAVAESLTGWKSAEAVGQPLDTMFRIVNEKTRQPTPSPATRAIKEGVIVGLANHTVLIAKDGTERPIDDSAAPIRCKDGEIVGCVLVFRDVSERREAERAARSLASIVESSDDAIIGKDINGVITSWNRAAERLYGYSAAEAIGRPIAILAPPDRADEMPAILARLKQGERIEHFDTVRRAKDGRLVPISFTMSPIKDEDGAIVGASKIARDISERKRAEKALHEEKERLHATLTGIGDAVIVTDANGRVTMMNRVAQSLTGWMEEAVGQALDEVFRIVNEQTRKPVESPATRALREGGIVGLANHTVLIRKDGTERPIDDSAAPIFDAQGQVIGCVLVFRDITERRRAEDERREVIARLDSLIAHAPIGIALFDADLRFITINDQAAAIDGISKDAHLGKTVCELLPELGPKVETLLRQVRDTGKPLIGAHITGETPAAPGQRRHWIANYYPVQDGIGRAGAIGAVALEITDLKRAEDELRRAEERIRSVVNNVIDGIITIDERGMVQSFNPAAERLFGYSASEVTGQNVKMLMPEPYHNEHDTYLSNYLVTGKARIIGIGREVVGLRKNDSTFPMELAVGEFSLGGRRHFTGIVRDISERKQAEAELRERAADVAVALAKRTEEARRAEKAEQQLREADRRKNEFLATLAHELRNPLAPVRNAVQILLMKGPPDPDLKWGRAVIDRQVQHMARLLDDLLDVSRITHNKLELRKERVEMAAVVQSAVETSRPLIDSGGQELTVALPDQHVYLDADPVRLAQVFSNLLNNAAKYSEPGGHIRLTCERQGRDVVVSVKDDGVGIAAEMLPRIFDIFSQSKRVLERSQGGLGIGLSLVRGLVELHGGSIEARSEGQDKGSEFIVRLPVIVAKVVQESSPPSKDGEQPRVRKCRLLIVDDLKDSADSLAMLLKMIGHEVHTAYDGEDAIIAAERFTPEVILLDIGMPKLNGYDACRRIRQQPWGKGMYLVALTGWGQEDDRRRTEAAGFDHHMVKPVDPSELMKLLASLPAEQESS